jgi:hypothetical protein
VRVALPHAGKEADEARACTVDHSKGSGGGGEGAEPGQEGRAYPHRLHYADQEVTVDCVI